MGGIACSNVILVFGIHAVIAHCFCIRTIVKVDCERDFLKIAGRNNKAEHRADYSYTTVPNFGILKNDMDDGYGCILVPLYSSEPCLEPIGRRLN